MTTDAYIWPPASCDPTHYCHLCGLVLTRITEIHQGIAYTWEYCADHPQADQDAFSIPVTVEAH